MPRLIGYILDSLLVAAVIVVASAVFFALGTIFPWIGAIGLWIALVLVPLGYFPYFWAKQGQTPGMRYSKVRVVRDADGGPLTGGQAVLRLIGYWVSGFAFSLGFFWIFIDKRERGWFDLIAKTVVINVED